MKIYDPTSAHHSCACNDSGNDSHNMLLHHVQETVDHQIFITLSWRLVLLYFTLSNVIYFSEHVCCKENFSPGAVSGHNLT